MTNGQPEDEGEEPAGRLTVNRPLALMIGSVAAGIILIFAYSGQYSEATRGLGEALVIAGLLGLTVDSYLKRSLVREVGNLALRALFGTNSPQEYVDLLSDSLRAVQLVSLVNDYRLRLELASPGVVRVTSEVWVDLVNVSTRIWTSTDPQLAASKAGTEPSRFIEYEITTRQPQVGRRVVSSTVQRFTVEENPEISNAQVHNKDGVAILDREQLPGWQPALVTPGGTASIRMKAITHQPCQGGIPLVTRTPVLNVSLHVSGPGLAELEVVPYIGSQILQPAGDGTAADRLDFSYGFVNAQSTLRVEWAPRAG